MDSELALVLSQPALLAAPRLVGAELLVSGVGGRVVEVEAYDENDPASHCYGGPRGRNVPMFLPGGHIYVYRSYGVHWCMNIVTGEEGRGEAVLLRGLDPTHRLPEMYRRRGMMAPHLLARGPGNLTKAIGVSEAENGQMLGEKVVLTLAKEQPHITVGKRVGITVAIDEPRRFFETGNKSVTHPCRI